MSKSIKLKNNTYIDSSSIVSKTNTGEKNILNDILGNWGNTTSIYDYNGDLNDLLRTGWVMVGGQNGNVPPNVDGDGCYYVITFVKNPQYYVKQIAFSRGGYVIFQRNKLGTNTWSGWSRII